MIERPNGCGPKGWLGKLIPDHLFGLSVNEACDLHDEQYIQGGNDYQRKLADQIFLNGILDKIRNTNDKKLISFLRKISAYSYYFAIRLFGNTFFRKA